VRPSSSEPLPSDLSGQRGGGVVPRTCSSSRPRPRSSPERRASRTPEPPGPRARRYGGLHPAAECTRTASRAPGVRRGDDSRRNRRAMPSADEDALPPAEHDRSISRSSSFDEVVLASKASPPSALPMMLMSPPGCPPAQIALTFSRARSRPDDRAWATHSPRSSSVQESDTDVLLHVVHPSR